MHADPPSNPQGPWQWRFVIDADEAHHLLLLSDAFHATPHHPAPARQWQTSRRHAEARAVHGLYRGSQLVGMVTLTPTPPFGVDPAAFESQMDALYMQRLAVHPSYQRSPDMVGLRCVRHAVEWAVEHHAHAIRAELSPRLPDVMRLLCMAGFTCWSVLANADRQAAVVLAEQRLQR